MDIAQVLGGIAAVILLLFVCSGSKKDTPKYEQGEIRMSRDLDGTFYVYEVQTGQPIAQGMTKEEAAEYILNLTQR